MTTRVTKDETGSGIDHGLLTGLADDDHTQYALLAGRSGGQTLYGGTAASNTLVLGSTSHATLGTIDLMHKVRLGTGLTTFTGETNLFTCTAALVTSATTGRFRAVRVEGTLRWDHTPASTTMVLFNMAASYQNNTGTLAMTPCQIFANNIVLNAVSNTTDMSVRTVQHAPNFAQADYLGASATGKVAAESIGLNSGGVVALGWTVTDWYGVKMDDPTGTGSVGTMVGLDVSNLTKGALNLSVRSDGAAVQMRHAGPVIIGTAGSAPNTTKGLDLAGTFATRASALTLSNGANNNIALGTTSFARITGPTAVFNITGITDGIDGKRVIIYNTTAFAMTLNNENSGSSLCNRITTTTGADISTVLQGSIEVFYDKSATDTATVDNTTDLVQTATPHGFAAGREVVFSGTTAPTGVFFANTSVTCATNDEITLTAHGFVANQPVLFRGTTAPTGITFGTTYYVSSSGLGANVFKVSTRPGGTVLDISSTGTAVTVTPTYFVLSSLLSATEFRVGGVAGGSLINFTTAGTAVSVTTGRWVVIGNVL